jgi:hypothetical protein
MSQSRAVPKPRDPGVAVLLLILAAMLSSSGYVAWRLSDMSNGVDPERYARFKQSL